MHRLYTPHEARFREKQLAFSRSEMSLHSLGCQGHWSGFVAQARSPLLLPAETLSYRVIRKHLQPFLSVTDEE